MLIMTLIASCPIGTTFPQASQARGGDPATGGGVNWSNGFNMVLTPTESFKGQSPTCCNVYLGPVGAIEAHRLTT